MADQFRAVEPLFLYHFEDGLGSNLLPADEGAWSLEGIAHAATLVTHFLAEGQVRHRAPYSDKFRILIAPPVRGSWEAQFMVALTSPEVWAGVMAGMSVSIPSLAYKLLRRVSNRATGVPPTADEAEAIEQRNPGTFQALVEAAEPSLVRAHRVVSNERTTIDFALGSMSFQFNRETKEYIETNIVDPGSIRAVGNVASFNVNRRTGRLFIDELGRSVPFLIHRDASPTTAIALARSLENYASTRLANSDLDVRLKATRAPDGDIKRIVIYDARFLLGVLGS